MREPDARALLGTVAAALAAPALLILGCDAVDVMDPTPPHDATFEELDQRILELIGTPACADVSSCASMAIGVKPCGGPWRYLVYSRAVTDERTLAAVVSEYNEIDRRSPRYGTISDCSIVMPPALSCASGVCVAR